jgi:hypothetical protein
MCDQLTYNRSFVPLTESPTVPRPNITTLEPFDTLATFQAAPSPNKWNNQQRDDQIAYIWTISAK